MAFYQLDGKVTLLAGKKEKVLSEQCETVLWPTCLPALSATAEGNSSTWPDGQHISVVPGGNIWSVPSPLTHPLPDSYSLYPTIKTPGTAYAWGNKALGAVRKIMWWLKEALWTPGLWGQSSPQFCTISHTAEVVRGSGILQCFFVIKLCCTVSFCYNRSGRLAMHSNLFRSHLSMKNDWKKYI